MKYALIEEGVVKELLETDQDISTMFHPSVVWIEAGETVQCGYVYSGEVFSKPIPEIKILTKEETENLRLVAYANPILGCDRYFAEVMSLQAEGFAATSTEVKDAKAKGLSRKLEIQALYPYPAE